MQYIKDADYQYISNKYHDTTKPFNSLNRFIRHDEIFNPKTGMDGDEIINQLLILDESTANLPNPIRKAKAFAFVLENTRISCDPRDIFPAINTMDRPIDKTVIKKRNDEVFLKIIPEIDEKRNFYGRTGAASLWPDFCHSVPHWEILFELGFSGLLKKSEEMRASKTLDAEQDAFYESIKITYEAVLHLIDRLQTLASTTKGSERLAKALKNIAQNPPETFYEVLLFDYIYFIISEHIDGMQARSLCNFDRVLYPYYKKDLEKGVTEQEIRTDLAYFLMQFTAIGNYWGQPVYLGGCNQDESTVINELSYIFLDVYDQLKLLNPKIQIKVADSTPKDFLLKALDMIRRGGNSVVFVSDATIRKALMQSGATSEQARLCDVKGCYEYAPQGEMHTGMNYINLVKPLEYTLHRGCDGITGEFAGLETPDVADIATFDDFFDIYKQQLLYLVKNVMRVVNIYEGYLFHINPTPLLSATYPTCLERARDSLYGGAARNTTSLDVGFLADAADSLVAIKKFVYDQKEISLPELVHVLDNNYEGNESLRQKLYKDRDKYGNNRDLPDGIAKEIVDFLVENVHGKPNNEQRNGHWSVSFHVARMSYVQGAKTMATPNGRKLGEELAKNVSASMGQNRDGATAAILSATNFDASSFCGDACLDLGLLPKSVDGEKGLESMYALLLTFIKRGGQAMHINVFDAETLIEAQKNPDKYQDLQIRVCGWSVLWNNINKPEQDGFIKQAKELC